MSLAILCVVSIWHAMVTLIPTDAVFEQEDVMNVLKFSSLDSTTLSRLENNQTFSTAMPQELNDSAFEFNSSSLPFTTLSTAATGKTTQKKVSYPFFTQVRRFTSQGCITTDNRQRLGDTECSLVYFFHET